jgi:hypothetical protein
MYKLSIDELKEVKKQIDELLEKGFIRPSTNPCGSSILFVPNKDGELRMCVDYRALNNATIRNNYPLPRIDEVWDQIGGSRLFSSRLCNYYRRFVRNFSTIEAPLTNLPKKNVAFEWDPTQEAAFSQLKEALINTPILSHPRAALAHLTSKMKGKRIDETV